MVKSSVSQKYLVLSHFYFSHSDRVYTDISLWFSNYKANQITMFHARRGGKKLSFHTVLLVRLIPFDMVNPLLGICPTRDFSHFKITKSPSDYLVFQNNLPIVKDSSGHKDVGLFFSADEESKEIRNKLSGPRVSILRSVYVKLSYG